MWKCEETPPGGVATKGTVPKFCYFKFLDATLYYKNIFKDKAQYLSISFITFLHKCRRFYFKN